MTLISFHSMCGNKTHMTIQHFANAFNLSTYSHFICINQFTLQKQSHVKSDLTHPDKKKINGLQRNLQICNIFFQLHFKKNRTLKVRLNV